MTELPLHTVWLIGPTGPATTSLTSILADLDCRVLRTVGPQEQTLELQANLIVIEYRPRDLPLTPFAATLAGLNRSPLVVVGPELSETATAELLFRCGARAYLRSGLTAAEKRALIRAHLPHVPQTYLTVGSLRIDLLENAAWYGAQRLDLTATQFKLLCTLMQSPGQPLDCPSLETLARCRGVPAHLATLRRKLAAHSGAFLLRGNPLQGYAVDARRQPRSSNVSFALRTHLKLLL